MFSGPPISAFQRQPPNKNPKSLSLRLCWSRDWSGVLDLEPSFREKEVAVSACSKLFHKDPALAVDQDAPGIEGWKKLWSLAHAQERTGNGSVFFFFPYLRPMVIVWKINEASFS